MPEKHRAPMTGHPIAGPQAPFDSVIVIFGAAVRPDGAPSTALRRRVEAAAAFGQRLPAPLYLPTGAIGRHGASEASVMAHLVLALGVPEDRILREETGTNTMSSVQAAATLLRQRGYSGPVYAATNTYHMPRCVMLLRLAGLDGKWGPAPLGPASRSLRRRWYWRLREVVALPVDLLIALWTRST